MADEEKRKRLTYYEILGIKEDSTDKDIRAAYVKLSKSCHPDSNLENKNLHEKFVIVQEAYQTLSKGETRKNYDLSLQYYRRSRYSQRGTTSKTVLENEPSKYYQRPWRDETIWEMRDKSKDRPPESDSYYGIKGVRRVSNRVIAGFACGLLAIGALIHYTALRQSMTFAVRQLDVKDRRLAQSYQEVRDVAEHNGTERQVELFHEKIKEFETTKFSSQWDDR